MFASACGPVEFPVRFGVDPGFSAKEACLIEEAARRWEEAAPGLITIELVASIPQEAGIIRCDGSCNAGDSGLALGYCDALGGGNLWIHADRIRAFEHEWKQPYDSVFTATVMHEIGHHFGLRHAGHGVLRPEATENFEPCISRTDSRNLALAYGREYQVPECEPLSACEGLSPNR